MINENEVRSIVSEVLGRRFAHADFLRADTELAEDFDGEQIVRITAYFNHNAVTAPALFAASDEIRNQLKKAGDKRFVFIRQDVRGEVGDELRDESWSHQ